MSSVTVQTPFSDIGGTRNADTHVRLVSGLQPGILVFTDLAQRIGHRHSKKNVEELTGPALGFRHHLGRVFLKRSGVDVNDARFERPAWEDSRVCRNNHSHECMQQMSSLFPQSATLAAT